MLFECEKALITTLLTLLNKLISSLKSIEDYEDFFAYAYACTQSLHLKIYILKIHVTIFFLQKHSKKALNAWSLWLIRSWPYPGNY